VFPYKDIKKNATDFTDFMDLFIGFESVKSVKSVAFLSRANTTSALSWQAYINVFFIGRYTLMSYQLLSPMLTMLRSMKDPPGSVI
jgi:hypothetical protein